MDSNTAGPAAPLSFVNSRTNANQVTGAVAGVNNIVTFQLDDLQFLNGIIDRPTTNRFRALIDGYYSIAYGLSMFAAANDRGAEVNVILNGITEIDRLRAASNGGKAVAARPNHIGKSGIVLLSANDFLEIGVDPVEGTAMTLLGARCNAVFQLVKPV